MCTSLHICSEINWSYHEIIAKLIYTFVNWFLYCRRGNDYFLYMIIKIMWYIKDNTREKFQLSWKYTLSGKFRYYWLLRWVSCTGSFSKTFPTWLKMNQYLLMKDYLHQYNFERGRQTLNLVSYYVKETPISVQSVEWRTKQHYPWLAIDFSC